MSPQIYKWQISANSDGEEGPAPGGGSEPQLHSFRMSEFSNIVSGDRLKSTGDTNKIVLNNHHQGLKLC
jgi:hypothetical protein